MMKHFIKKYGDLLALLVCLILLQYIQTHPMWIETYYSNGLYPIMGKVQRILLGWLPFSLGDVLIAVAIIWCLYRMVKNIIRWKRERKWAIIRNALLSFAYIVLWAYVGFYVIWGLAYYRMGSSYQLAIEPVQYTTADLDTLLQHLDKRLHEVCADSAAIDGEKTQNRKVLATLSKQAYDRAAEQYPFLKFEYSSLKPMLLGPLQSYTGYAGYLFPFTGEAHVNFYAPPLDLPFTVCHEMAHQLGYGSESEANMVGFLAARAHRSAWYRYSAYSNMQGYAQLEMLNRDTLLFKQYRDQIPALLKRDRAINDSFYAKHTSPVQPIINWVYEKYLLSNNQPMGIQSYNYVVAWLVAYGKKYGWEAL